MTGTKSFYLKTLLLGSTLILQASNFAFAKDLSEKTKSFLSRPLILGASVSSGKHTKGPGDRAAEMAGSTSIQNLARSGQKATQYEFLQEAVVADRTSIIAIDLLFWDSTARDTRKSIETTNKLLSYAKKKQIPLVLGDIPLVVTGWRSLLKPQRNRDILNSYIRSVCRPENNCLLLEFDRLHRVSSSVGITIKGKKYFYRDLAPDGKHLNAVASEHVAEMIVDLLTR